MGMTMTQKILAHHARMKSVEAGALIEADVDLVLGNDVTTPVAISVFEQIGKKEVFDRSKVVIVPDHFVPNKDIRSAQQCARCRRFAAEKGIEHFFELGEMGIEHVLLPEKGLVSAGDLVVGADSHTCTYGALGAFSTGVGSTDMAVAMAVGKCWFKVPRAVLFRLHGKLKSEVCGKDLILHIIGKIGVSGALYQSMEFSGDGVASLSMDDRFTVANMAIEAGAKNGIFPVDAKTLSYLAEHSCKPYRIFEPDPDASYEAIFDIDLSSVEQTVAFPHLPENTRTVTDLPDIKIDQAVIGSCTNGRIQDLRQAAAVLKGRSVKKGIRLLIIPATQAVYLQALDEGLIRIFIEAGAVVSTPTCGPCLGGHMGVLAPGERAVSTTNRNFVGRMGHPESEVYLASPFVAAASAVLGRLAGTQELLK